MSAQLTTHSMVVATLSAFQNYLRTQAGNTTTVNIIITTVDYLLRLQESISDFYWHYSDHDTIDLPGKDNFLKAFKVVKQVFRTLTEYIQVSVCMCIERDPAGIQNRVGSTPVRSSYQLSYWDSGIGVEYSLYTHRYRSIHRLGSVFTPPPPPRDLV